MKTKMGYIPFLAFLLTSASVSAVAENGENLPSDEARETLKTFKDEITQMESGNGNQSLAGTDLNPNNRRGQPSEPRGLTVNDAWQTQIDDLYTITSSMQSEMNQIDQSVTRNTRDVNNVDNSVSSIEGDVYRNSSDIIDNSRDISRNEYDITQLDQKIDETGNGGPDKTQKLYHSLTGPDHVNGRYTPYGTESTCRNDYGGTPTGYGNFSYGKSWTGKYVMCLY